MAYLNSDICSIDKNSGAVIIRKSPELQEILELKKEIKSINEKLEHICKLLDKNETN